MSGHNDYIVASVSCSRANSHAVDHQWYNQRDRMKASLHVFPLQDSEFIQPIRMVDRTPNAVGFPTTVSDVRVLETSVSDNIHSITIASSSAFHTMLSKMPCALRKPGLGQARNTFVGTSTEQPSTISYGLQYRNLPVSYFTENHTDTYIDGIPSTLEYRLHESDSSIGKLDQRGQHISHMDFGLSSIRGVYQLKSDGRHECLSAHQHSLHHEYSKELWHHQCVDNFCRDEEHVNMKASLIASNFQGKQPFVNCRHQHFDDISCLHSHELPFKNFHYSTSNVKPFTSASPKLNFNQQPFVGNSLLCNNIYGLDNFANTARLSCEHHFSYANPQFHHHYNNPKNVDSVCHGKIISFPSLSQLTFLTPDQRLTGKNNIGSHKDVTVHSFTQIAPLTILRPTFSQSLIDSDQSTECHSKLLLDAISSNNEFSGVYKQSIGSVCLGDKHFNIDSQINQQPMYDSQAYIIGCGKETPLDLSNNVEKRLAVRVSTKLVTVSTKDEIVYSVCGKFRYNVISSGKKLPLTSEVHHNTQTSFSHSSCWSSFSKSSNRSVISDQKSSTYSQYNHHRHEGQRFAYSSSCAIPFSVTLSDKLLMNDYATHAFHNLHWSSAKKIQNGNDANCVTAFTNDKRYKSFAFVSSLADDGDQSHTCIHSTSTIYPMNNPSIQGSFTVERSEIKDDSPLHSQLHVSEELFCHAPKQQHVEKHGHQRKHRCAFPCSRLSLEDKFVHQHNATTNTKEYVSNPECNMFSTTYHSLNQHTKGSTNKHRNRVQKGHSDCFLKKEMQSISDEKQFRKLNRLRRSSVTRHQNSHRVCYDRPQDCSSAGFHLSGEVGKAYFSVPCDGSCPSLEIESERNRTLVRSPMTAYRIRCSSLGKMADNHQRMSKDVVELRVTFGDNAVPYSINNFAQTNDVTTGTEFNGNIFSGQIATAITSKDSIGFNPCNCKRNTKTAELSSLSHGSSYSYNNFYVDSSVNGCLTCVDGIIKPETENERIVSDVTVETDYLLQKKNNAVRMECVGIKSVKEVGGFTSSSVDIPCLSSQNLSLISTMSPSISILSSNGEKAWSRKRMILNAFNKDEMLNNCQRNISGTIVSSYQTVVSDNKCLQYPVLCVSRAPVSPKMPILSPQEAGEDNHTLFQDNDPPKLHASSPERKGGACFREKCIFVLNGSTPSAVQPAVNSNGLLSSIEYSNVATIVSLSTSSKNDGRKIIHPIFLNSMSFFTSIGIPIKSAESNLFFRAENNCINKNRCVTSNINYGLIMCDALIEDFSKKKFRRTNSTREQYRQNALLPRRDSFDRSWRHQKNIPVANVAPFDCKMITDKSSKMKTNDVSRTFSPSLSYMLADKHPQYNQYDNKSLSNKLRPSCTIAFLPNKQRKGNRVASLTSESLTVSVSTTVSEARPITNEKQHYSFTTISSPQCSTLHIAGSVNRMLFHEQNNIEIVSAAKLNVVKVGNHTTKLTGSNCYRNKKNSLASSSEMILKSHSPGLADQSVLSPNVVFTTDPTKDKCALKVHAKNNMPKVPRRSNSNRCLDSCFENEEIKNKRICLEQNEPIRRVLPQKQSKENLNVDKLDEALLRSRSCNGKTRHSRSVFLHEREESYGIQSTKTNRSTKRDTNKPVRSRFRKPSSRPSSANVYHFRKHDVQSHTHYFDMDNDADPYTSHEEDNDCLPVGDVPWEPTCGKLARKVHPSTGKLRHLRCRKHVHPRHVVKKASKSFTAMRNVNAKSYPKSIYGCDAIKDDNIGHEMVGFPGDSSGLGSRNIASDRLYNVKTRRLNLGKRPVKLNLSDRRLNVHSDTRKEDMCYQMKFGNKDVKRIVVDKRSGETLLHCAARLGNEEVLLYCLRSGRYDVNSCDNAGYTALHEACVKGNVKVSKLLIQAGADISCCSLDGIRPIHDAVENDHAEMVRLLFSVGADPMIATYGGRTPIMICHSIIMADLIKGYLGDLNGCNSEEEREWQMPGSYGLSDNAANQDNGFDIFADVPTDIDDEDVSIGNMFDDNTAASVLVTQLPAESPDRNPLAPVVRDDVVRKTQSEYRDLSSIPSCQIKLMLV